MTKIFEFLYGSQVYYPYSRSCSISKQILAFVGVSNNSIQGPFFQTNLQEMSILPKLKYYFDFVKASSKNQQIYNLAPEYQTCYSANSVDSINWPYYQFKCKGQFISDYSINFQEESGIIISFDFLVTTHDTNYYNGILSIINQDVISPQVIVLYVFRYDQGRIYDLIVDKNYGRHDSPQQAIVQNVQHRITIIFKLNFGSFFQQCNGCNIYINNLDCFSCQDSNDYLKLDQIYTCQPSCIYPYISSSSNLCTLDISNQSQCKIDGQDLFQQAGCTCPEGQYFDIHSNKCVNCLYYCKSCQTPFTCDTYLYSQNLKGQCDQNSFDNETQCISNYLNILSRQNQMFLIDSNQIFCSTQSNIYILQNFMVRDNALRLGWESNSFFFTLNFNLKISQLNQQNIYTICYLMNKNTHIFSLISQFNSQNNLQLKLIVDNNDIILQAYIEADTDTWIGFYYDSLGINLALKYKYQQISYYRISRKNIIKYNLDDPYLIIGIQSPLFQNGYPLCGLIGDNNWIIKGDNSMRNFFNELIQFSEIDTNMIVDFNLLDYQLELQQKQLALSNRGDSSLTLNFINNNYVFDDQIGMMMTPQNESIIRLGNKINQVPFSFMLQIKPIDYSQCGNYYFNILTFVLSSNAQIIFRIKTDQYIRQKYYLEVCTYDYNCKRFQKSKINYSQPNNLFFKISYLEYSSSLVIVKFNLVSNYISDEIEMQLPFITSGNPIFYDIKLGDQYSNFYLKPLSNNHPIFFSRIQIFLGGFYYLSYDNKDPCFIYINRRNMTCIYPKKDYVIKDGIAIPKNDCNKNNKLNDQLLYYNENTKTCQNSGLFIPNCVNINIQTKLCIQCIDNKMVLPKCQCPDGMFLQQDSNSCKYCSSQCLTCAQTQNNCLTCKNSLQIPPSCKCQYNDYYLDSDNICRQCNSNCSSCKDRPDYCLTCSQFRINPPQCNCNPDLYYLDQITNSCLPKICPNKCKQCNQNNQCTQCRGDRLYPPDCNCGEGFYDDPSQENCQKCQEGFYYDVVQKKCEKCFYSCATCFGNLKFNCNSCLFNLKLTENNECVCPNNLTMPINSNQCYSLMKIQFNQQFVNNQYQLVIKFDYPIDLLPQRIQGQGINSLFQLQINQLNNNLYQIQRYFISENNQQLTIILQIPNNIQKTDGYLLFQQTYFFYNKQFMYALDPIYSKKPLSFVIGPFFQNTTFKYLLIKYLQKISNLQAQQINFRQYSIQQIQFNLLLCSCFQMFSIHQIYISFWLVLENKSLGMLKIANLLFKIKVILIWEQIQINMFKEAQKYNQINQDLATQYLLIAN
ncbi:bowman-birk serine protease inhibitor family protein (macronuclear) [Tetrahymena thermophila SB210]|uniref:Bowman-birk serine protease inhibitor family protein n=1 Tax=Tetrahymena thermophila (strain SB210) TaxID=312017 RepID=Q24D66_TETTS|nr:bowman-birk serine protease inhibitor family protein [Tetrahymena thermophila SB210]EAS05723.2 bowman-birk serine protease inhibitor family protein [Tetrahymena thermophila SB210]|eukprot:XP_001025968.2 bowman-birk serine protease inhibitor family protein [Tetrahymena thermophila SB210]